MASEERFGYEWKKYAAMSDAYEGQFRNWTNLTPRDAQGKDILDAGCGMGRNSYWPLVWGARSVTAFDNDERSLASARATLASFPNATVVKCDISHIEWQSKFDTVVCIGVLHHLRNPRLALENLLTALRPGGTLIVWVYSYEGNEWLVRYINPVRIHITSKLPPALVHFFAYFCSVPLYMFVKVARGPSAYFKQLATFDFWHLHSIVFDQLIPAVANYWTRDEVRALVATLPVSHAVVEKTSHGTGWILTCTT